MSIRLRTTAKASVILSLGLLLASRSYAYQYSVTDLGVVPGHPATDFHLGVAMNQSGHVAGWAGQYFQDFTQGFYWDGSTMNAISPLAGSAYSAAWSINSANMVVGFSFNQSVPYTFTDSHAFSYSAGVTTALGDPIGYDNSFAYGVNDHGVVAGGSLTGTGGGVAWVYSNATFTLLAGLPGFDSSYATGINNAGQILGASYDSVTFISHGWIYSGGTFTDLGLLTDTQYNYPYAMNAFGEATGYACGANCGAYLYSGGSITNLALLPDGTDNYGYGINSYGDVVGSTYSTNGYYYATLYSGGNAVDLNTQLNSTGDGWVLNEAYAINDAGQITGWGTLNGEYRAFILDAIPEPSSLGLILIGALWLRRIRR